ncbi:hypothetical protein OHB12_28580 [Nocardia sp. NBC_01730]|uniref:hypothetical protein n=1 Tax=Nocardia sp. NBC_01730 TaxID=2975998 RepID=UPI002E120699|nr:hypothetical protein OHB12_28580 [Nocardia sp. NBC_01730]
MGNQAGNSRDFRAGRQPVTHHVHTPWDRHPGPAKGQYFDAYPMIDIYSRYLVSDHVRIHESGVLTTESMNEIFGVRANP